MPAFAFPRRRCAVHALPHRLRIQPPASEYRQHLVHHRASHRGGIAGSIPRPRCGFHLAISLASTSTTSPSTPARQPNGYRDAHGNRYDIGDTDDDAHAFTHGLDHANGDAQSLAYRNGDGYRLSHAHSNAERYADSHGDAEPDQHANAYSFAIADTIADADGDRYAHGNSDTNRYLEPGWPTCAARAQDLGAANHVGCATEVHAVIICQASPSVLSCSRGFYPS